MLNRVHFYSDKTVLNQNHEISIFRQIVETGLFHFKSQNVMKKPKYLAVDIYLGQTSYVFLLIIDLNTSPWSNL